MNERNDILICPAVSAVGNRSPGVKRDKIIEIKINFSRRFRIYLLYAFAGLIIASPLPDEVGVMMLSGLTSINTKTMILISFLFNSLGILIMSLI